MTEKQNDMSLTACVSFSVDISVADIFKYKGIWMHSSLRLRQGTERIQILVALWDQVIFVSLSPTSTPSPPTKLISFLV